jgi:hypothetical protein
MVAGHKTSRFYGPFAASLPDVLTPILDKYMQVFAFELGGEAAYLFHPPQSGFDRPMESSAWSGWVKRLFKRHVGVEIAPKTLRSVFITWLRNIPQTEYPPRLLSPSCSEGSCSIAALSGDNTAVPEILKSAAHAMKHSEARQASSDYDQESDDRAPISIACEPACRIITCAALPSIHSPIGSLPCSGPQVSLKLHTTSI